MDIKDWHLKERRQALGLSQMQLAANAGISLPTLQNLESRKAQNPSLDVLNRLAAQLGVKLTLTSPVPDWDYLAACGLPILAVKSFPLKWDVARLQSELRLAINSLQELPDPRRQKAIVAFASALYSHYNKYAIQNNFSFLKTYANHSQIDQNEILKLRRLALATLQKVL